MTEAAGADDRVWDVAVVGCGPAGSAAAIGALHTDPSASVLMVDRSTFPRDKSCGDAVLGAALDLLEQVGVPPAELIGGYGAVHAMRLVSPRGFEVTRPLPDATIVLPRAVFDDRLFGTARDRGAAARRLAVRSVRDSGDVVEIGGGVRARVVIGADGAESVVRRAVEPAGERDLAVAIRGYDRAAGDATPSLVFDRRAGMAYAWRFPSTAGPANVGYGHLLRPGERAARGDLLASMHRLLPGVEVEATTLRAARLPLSTGARRPAKGRVLLAGDAASLINPISGEGIYYAISSGLAAGAAAVRHPDSAADVYSAWSRRRFRRHHRHIGLLATLARSDRVLEAGLRVAARRQRAFDEIAGLALAEGLISSRLALDLAGELIASAVPSRRR